MTMRRRKNKITARCLILIIKTELGMSRQKAQTALFIYQGSGSICFKCCREEMSNEQPSAPYQQEVKRNFLHHTQCLWIPSLRETHTHIQQKFLLCEEGTDPALLSITRLMMQLL